MKVALIIENFGTGGGPDGGPGGGGAERSTLQIAMELAGRGHEVTVLAGWAYDRQEAGIAIRQFRKHKWRGAMSLLSFTRWAQNTIQTGGFDTSLSVTTAVAAAVVQPRSGTIRETLERNFALRQGGLGRAVKRLLVLASPKRQLLLALERRTLRSPRVKRLVAVSQYVSDQLQRHYGADPARIEIIPNAAKMPTIDTATRQAWRKEVRQGFNIPDGATVFLFAALNPRLKGFDTLMRAMVEIQKRELAGAVVLLLAGEMKYPQQHQAASLGIREHVRFVGQTEHMAELYCAADVTVLPTYYDPSSKVVIESLMMGTPAISTSFNGASDFIAPPDAPRRGRVIADPADHAALAQAMIELTDPAELERCRAATAGMGDALSMRRHVDRLEQVLIAAGKIP